MPSTGLRRRILIIRNPISGRAGGGLGTEVLALLHPHAEVVLRDTLKRGDAEAFARDAQDFDRIVIAGGDGTIGEAFAGLLARGDKPPALGIIPLGTANVLANELELPKEPDALAHSILLGPLRAIHPGLANDRPFAVMAGVGLDAHVVANVSTKLKRLMGKGAYVAETLRQIGVFAFPRYRVILDGKEYTAASVVVAKGHFYGGRFIVCPDASLSEPVFQVALFESNGPLAALGFATALALGQLPRFVSQFSARKIEIDGPVGDPVQGDGDVLTRLPVTIEIAPRTLDCACGGLGQVPTRPI